LAHIQPTFLKNVNHETARKDIWLCRDSILAITETAALCSCIESWRSRDDKFEYRVINHATTSRVLTTRRWKIIHGRPNGLLVKPCLCNKFVYCQTIFTIFGTLYNTL